MEDTQVTTYDEAAWNAAMAEQAQDAGPSMPTPPRLRMHGDTGKFTVSRRIDGETVVSEVEDKELNVVVIAKRYLVRWKFEKDAPVDVFSREFAEFDQPIHLLTVDNRNHDRETNSTVTVYPSYAALKEEFTSTDKITKKVTSAFDLWVSLYVIVGQHHESTEEGERLVERQVMNFRFKGESRSNFFDANLPGAVSSKLVRVGVESKEKPSSKKDEPDIYYAATFKAVGDTPVNLRADVLRAISDIRDWMKFYEDRRAALPKPGTVTVPSLPPARDDVPEPENITDYRGQEMPQEKAITMRGGREEEIRIEDIPF